MQNKGLTMTIVFEAESANYGEGIGNVANYQEEMEINIHISQDRL